MSNHRLTGLTKSADDPTSFTPVGNSADSPELILRPLLVTGHDAELLSAEEADPGYDAGELFSMVVGEVMGERYPTSSTVGLVLR